jgi:hypothetical protein
MAFQSEILNTLRGTSIIRVADVGSITVALTDLRANAYTETVSEADIKRVYWSTNGAIRITRNSIPILMLHSAGEMRLDDLGYSISNNNTQSITIEVITGGSLVMEVSKRATYNVDPYTGDTIR